MMFPPVSAAILFTLAYTDQFEYPLTSSELFSRLIAIDQKKVSKNAFEKELVLLQKQKRILAVGEYFTLPGRSQIVQTRQRRAQFSAKKWREILLLQKMTWFLPDVLAIFVTGSLAMNNTDEDDDIDLLVVTKRNRLWVSRLELLLITWVLGRKKRRFEEGKHGWCLNLWLDEDHLQVAKPKQDLYQAYEVMQATPIVGESWVIDRFYEANTWVSRYLLQAKPASHPALKLIPQNSSLKKTKPGLFDQVEKWAYQLQLQYMQSHRTTEKVDPGFAFFHPRPTASLVKDGWLSSIQRSKNTQGIGTIAKQYAGKFFTHTN